MTIVIHQIMSKMYDNDINTCMKWIMNLYTNIYMIVVIVNDLSFHIFHTHTHIITYKYNIYHYKKSFITCHTFSFVGTISDHRQVERHQRWYRKSKDHIFLYCQLYNIKLIWILSWLLSVCLFSHEDMCVCMCIRDCLDSV